MAYEDMVGQRPGIDTMREVVCTQKLRPQIPPTWRDHPVRDHSSTTATLLLMYICYPSHKLTALGKLCCVAFCCVVLCCLALSF